jgi:soluble lytic murein transglycosylase-like protein
MQKKNLFSGFFLDCLLEVFLGLFFTLFLFFLSPNLAAKFSTKSSKDSSFQGLLQRASLKNSFRKTWRQEQLTFEKNLFLDQSAVSTEQIISFFSSHPPLSYQGWILFHGALKKKGISLKICQKNFQTFWIMDDRLSIKELTDLSQNFKGLLSASDHSHRLHYQLWQASPETSLKPLLNFIQSFGAQLVKKDELTLIAQLLEKENAKNLDSAGQFTLYKKKHSILLDYALCRFYLRKGMLNQAFEQWKRHKCEFVAAYPVPAPKVLQDIAQQQAVEFPVILAREFLQAGNEVEKVQNFEVAQPFYDKAQRVLESTLESGFGSAEQLWLAGFVQMHKKNWKKALNCFERLANISQAEGVGALSCPKDRAIWKRIPKFSYQRYESRASFWAGICCDKMGSSQRATAYFGQAACYPFFFYGQMALVYLKKPVTMSFVASKEIPLSAYQDEKVLWGVRALQEAGQNKQSGHSWLIASDLVNILKTPSEIWSFLQVLSKWIPDMATFFAKKFSSWRHATFYKAFPIRSLAVPFQDPALVWAIALNETSFNPSVVSCKGALGVMQVMPSDVQKYAQLAGLPEVNCLKKMQDFDYGMRVGVEELKEKLQICQGFYPLCVIAYNAGARRAYGWLEKLAWCKKEDILETLMWIEHIPFSESRNYVINTLSNYFVYRWLLKKPVGWREARSLLQMRRLKP